MKLLSLQEASPPVQFPISQEIFARARKDRRGGPNITQENIGKFAAWFEVQINAIGKSDLPRIVWEGLEGLKGNPQEVEKIFADYVQIYQDDDDGTEIEWSEEAREEAIEELVDDFFRFSSGRKTR